MPPLPWAEELCLLRKDGGDDHHGEEQQDWERILHQEELHLSVLLGHLCCDMSGLPSSIHWPDKTDHGGQALWPQE